MLKRRSVSAKIKCCGYFSHPLDGTHETSPEAFGHCCRNSSKKLHQGFVIIKGKRMGSYLLKAQLHQMQSTHTGVSFCIFL